jgi:hypothetical protein
MGWFFVFCASVLLLFVASMPRRTEGVNSTNSHSHHSHSHHSHSHKSHSHHSHSHESKSQSLSQSQSYGNCNASSQASFPQPAPPEHTNTSFPIWPTKITVYLPGDQKSHSSASQRILFWYNYSYFRGANPNSVQSCNFFPDFGNLPYVVGFESFITYTDSNPCNNLCGFAIKLALTCPLEDKSGKYFITLPNVGQIEIDLTVCLKEGTSDYGPNDCMEVPSTCRVTSPFASSAPATCEKKEHSGLSKADKVGISFGVIGFVLLVIIIVLAVLYSQQLLFNQQSKTSV